MEPEWISQNGEPLSGEERRWWFQERAEEARKAGAVMARYTIHDAIPNLILFEAWRERPEDQGEPRWQLTDKD